MDRYLRIFNISFYEGLRGERSRPEQLQNVQGELSIVWRQSGSELLRKSNAVRKIAPLPKWSYLQLWFR